LSQSFEDVTPVESGAQPAPEPEEAAKSQRLISPTGASVLALLVEAISTSAVIEVSAVKLCDILSHLLT
jgi:hypothetical protein